MRIRKLRLKNFRGYRESEFDFGDFTCLIGPNGIGKTTVLDAVSLLCSSLDFKADDRPPEATDEQWTPWVSGQQRLEAFLKRNILAFGRDDDPSGFVAEGTFEHDGNSFTVRINEKGYEVNEFIEQDWWWPGIFYFAKFDTEMSSFQLKESLWPRFKEHFEGITGYRVEPEVYTESDLAELGLESELVVGFWMDKGPRGRIHCRATSAGEKKVAKALSQIVNLDRPPHIALVDNLELHVHYKRHLRMFEEVKKLFQGMQVISTTHSTVIMDQYEPRSHIIDIEEKLS